jgi:hypothetical protein
MILHCRSVAGAWRTFVLCSNTPLFEEVSTNFTSRERTGNATEVLPSADNLPRVSIIGVGCSWIPNRLITFICYATATNLKTKRILSIGPQWESLNWRKQQCQLLDMYPIRVHRPTNWQWTTPDTLFGASRVCDFLHTADKPKKYSGVCSNERIYNERTLQRPVVVNKIRMLQRTQTLQRKRRNTIDRRSTRVRMTCRVLPLW